MGKKENEVIIKCIVPLELAEQCFSRKDLVNICGIACQFKRSPNYRNEGEAYIALKGIKDTVLLILQHMFNKMSEFIREVDGNRFPRLIKRPIVLNSIEFVWILEKQILDYIPF